MSVVGFPYKNSLVVLSKTKHHEKRKLKKTKDKGNIQEAAVKKIRALQLRRLKRNIILKGSIHEKLSVYELNYDHILDILKSFPIVYVNCSIFSESGALKAPKKALTI